MSAHLYCTVTPFFLSISPSVCRRLFFFCFFVCVWHVAPFKLAPFHVYSVRLRWMHVDRSCQICQRNATPSFSIRNIFISHRVSGLRRVNRQSRSHLQTFPSPWQAFHIFRSDLCTTACHSNWRNEHQTWRILQGPQDAADMISCTDGKVKGRQRENIYLCPLSKLCIDVGLNRLPRVVWKSNMTPLFGMLASIKDCSGAASHHYFSKSLYRFPRRRRTVSGRPFAALGQKFGILAGQSFALSIPIRHVSLWAHFLKSDEWGQKERRIHLFTTLRQWVQWILQKQNLAGSDGRSRHLCLQMLNVAKGCALMKHEGSITAFCYFPSLFRSDQRGSHVALSLILRLKGRTEGRRTW